MKPARGLFLSFSLITLPVIIESCCSSGWKCCDLPEARTYSVNDLSMKTRTFNGTDYIDAPLAIKPKEMSFNFKLDVTYLSMQQQNMFRPTMAAFACEPVPNSSKEKITGLFISSDHELQISDQTIIPAGADIKKYFSLAESLEGGPFYYESFNMVPNFLVPMPEDHEFTFRFTLDDGRIFELPSGYHKLMP